MLSHHHRAFLWHCLILIGVAVGLTNAIHAQEVVAHFDFTKQAALKADGVQLEHYKFTGKPENGQLSLKPYKLDSVIMPSNIEGSVTVPFNGKPGRYTLEVAYQDESDGNSQFTLRVNGQDIHRWRADSIFVTYVAKERIEHVQLAKGDKVQIHGDSHRTEYARLHGLTVLTGKAPVANQEPINIPQRNWSMDLVRLGNFSDYPDPQRLIPGRSGDWGKSKETVYYFIADRPGTFSAHVRPPSRTQYANGSYAIAKVPAGTTGPRKNLPESGQYTSFDQGELALLEFQIDEPGTYELHLTGAFTVTSSHELSRRIGSAATGEGFFWVPKETTAIRVTGSVSGSNLAYVAVKNPDGRIVWQGEIVDASGKIIRIPAAQRGQPWYIEYTGIGGAILGIDGVPPYLALHRADLLLPREVLGNKQEKTNSHQQLDAARPSLDAAVVQSGVTPVTLIDNAQPMAVIVSSAERTELVGEAAAILQRTLAQIGGPELPIVKTLRDVPSGKVAILLGTPDDFPDLKLPNEFTALNGAGFLLRSEQSAQGPRLLLIGRKPQAVQHAVATLLQLMGCRWYFPPEAWHVIPAAQTITVALDKLHEPSFIRRTTNGNKGNIGDWPFYNRLGSTINGPIQHSYGGFVSRSLYKDHPEYFAMQDTNKNGIGNKRVPNQPCTTHPQVIKLFKQGAIKRFQDDPTLELLAVTPNDNTYYMCRCERCRAVGTYSDCMWLLAHQVAEAVDEKFDGKKIAIMAYGRTSPPPTLDVPRDERIVAELATNFRYKVTFKEMLEGWPKFAGQITVYDYWAIGQWGAMKPGGHYDVAEATEDIKMYHRLGVVGLNGEGVGAWASTGLAMYVSARLMWDVNADVDAIVDRYYRDCFGKAADAMRSYEDRWQKGAKFDEVTLKLALLDLKRALQAAEHWPQQRRIASLALYMHTLKVFEDFKSTDKSTRTPEQTAAMIEAGDSYLWRFGHVGMYSMSVTRTYQHGFPWFGLDEVRQMIDQDLRDLNH